MEHTDEKYRAYFLTNMYLSSIQRGIQSAHVLHEMFIRYPDNVHSLCSVPLWEWARNHKTMIVLNGGYQSTIAEVYAELCHLAGEVCLPCAEFHEEEDSLNGALTAVGIILPESVYGVQFPDKDIAVFDETDEDIDDGEDALGRDVTDCQSAIWLPSIEIAKMRIKMLISQFRLA